MLGVVDVDVKLLSCDNLELCVCVCVCVCAMQMRMFWTLHVGAGVDMLGYIGEAGEGERTWEWDKYDSSVIWYLFIF